MMHKLCFLQLKMLPHTSSRTTRLSNVICVFVFYFDFKEWCHEPHVALVESHTSLSMEAIF